MSVVPDMEPYVPLNAFNTMLVGWRSSAARAEREPANKSEHTAAQTVVSASNTASIAFFAVLISFPPA